jgi:dihydroorotase
MRLAGGEVVTTSGLVRADVWVEGDRVVAIGDTGPDTYVVDVSGMFVGPGLVDIHTHLREPGAVWKEDIASGAHAAARGGYTAVVAMPNTAPPTDGPDRVAAIGERAREVGSCLVVAAGAMTRGRAGVEPADIGAMHRVGVRLFTDDGDAVGDPNVLAAVMWAAAPLPGAVVAQHAEGDPGDRGPSAAEWLMVGRDLRIAETTGARYHVQHASTRETVDLVREAKERGLDVTAEVTPHHLSLVDTDVTGPDFKMYPPLRSVLDRAALRDALMDGTIDAVATDHAPHSPAEKAVAFEDAPRGVIGLETAASVVWDVVEDVSALFRVMSSAPARIADISRHGWPVEVGSPANLTVFDPGRTWVVGEFASKSSNSPYTGRTMTGRPVMTILEGVITHQLEGVA